MRSMIAAALIIVLSLAQGAGAQGTLEQCLAEVDQALTELAECQDPSRIRSGSVLGFDLH